MRQLNIWLRSRWAPVAGIAIMSFIMIVPQLLTGSVIVGSDGIFHFNRIYDTAKQISTGYWSYWQTNFGFQQSGRVVNAVYGPYSAYLMGALLVVFRSWYHFQLFTTFAVYLIGGYGMYRLARSAGARMWPAFATAIIFMNIGWLPRWGLNQNMTALGAALLPYALACGVHMVRHREQPVQPVRLALIMSILIETHVLSTIFAVLALIPFWIVAWVRANHRLRMVGRTAAAVGITLVLTANVWGAMLLMFSTNRIAYPAAFSLAQNVLQIGVGRGSRNELALFPLAIIAGQVVLLLLQRRRTSRLNWCVTAMGVAILLAASRVMPWALIGRLVPKMSQMLQFPVRLTTIAFPLILCGLALSLSNMEWSRVSVRRVTSTLVVLAALGVAVPNVARMTIRSVDVQRSHVLRSFGAMLLLNSTPRELRATLHSKHPGAILATAEKHSSDYLPVNGHQGTGDLSPGSIYKREILFYHPYFTYTALPGGRLQISWHETTAGWQSVPVVTYHQSQVTVNGHRLTQEEYYRSRINAPIVQSRRGKNTMIVQFRAAWWAELLLWVAPLGWLALGAWCGWRRLRRRQSGVNAKVQADDI